MSRHVETTLTEAAAKNLSASATLEWLTDMELEARKLRAIERRYKCARLQQDRATCQQRKILKIKRQARLAWGARIPSSNLGSPTRFINNLSIYINTLLVSYGHKSHVEYSRAIGTAIVGALSPRLLRPPSALRLVREAPECSCGRISPMALHRTLVTLFAGFGAN
jgi:hypothetical protein